MKITSFNPNIVTKDAQEVIALFEALGFEKQHNLEGFANDEANRLVRMKHPDGFYVDITENPQIPQTVTEIRMNVDNFEEAYEMLEAKGFRNIRDGQIIETPSSRMAIMASPTGFGIDLVKHIKKEER